MKINKAFLPLIVALSVLIGAGGMYAGMGLVAGSSAVPVVEQGNDNNEEQNVEEAAGDSVTVDSEASDHIEKISSAYELILERYVEDIEEEKLLEGAISGMLETLEDPYSVYMDQQTAQEFMEQLESSFEGIGAEVSMNNGKVTIVSPIRDSPAEEAGLRPNDQIVEVDGEGLDGLSLYESVLKIRGEKGTTVTLTIERPGVNDLLTFEVTRDEIPLETVYSDIIEEDDKRIGILEIRSFSENTAERFAEELESLENDGIDGLIIDVRDNPGGLLQSVEDIGNLVVPGGEPVVQIEGRNGERMRHISNLSEEKPYPIVGLINEGSASASEILAAALKEAGDYELVGNTTFGKGTVQQSLPMGDGSEIKLTLYRWLTSDGNFINQEGVEPTIEVEQPEFFYVSPVSVEEDLEFDMNNEQVKNIQVMLDGLGYEPGRKDGYFGEETEEAVKRFQQAAGIEETGVVDEETAGQLQQEVIEAVQSREFDNQLKKAVELIVE
ncbi:S41 family peptidase [Evansella sp. LMS18]|uniref:S41 family peptidase n=1 Tax=Evansella sp. LMS18 TaxID=2924033 RepID=UPI0026F17D7F|nr:S41 family peptidase [Evansella sp. LMS18]